MKGEREKEEGGRSRSLLPRQVRPCSSPGFPSLVSVRFLNGVLVLLLAIHFRKERNTTARTRSFCARAPFSFFFRGLSDDLVPVFFFLPPLLLLPSFSLSRLPASCCTRAPSGQSLLLPFQLFPCQLLFLQCANSRWIRRRNRRAND